MLSNPFQVQLLNINSHVALVAVKLESSGFKRYRCDRPMPLGVNLLSLAKVLKCAKDDDECTLKAADEADLLNLVYEGKHSDRIAEYDMKLMDIDADTLGIPETEYEARITMPSGEFARIVRDLSQLGESVRIEVSKEGVRFASEGEAANGSVLLKPTGGAGVTRMRDEPKKEEDAEEVVDEDAEEDEDGVKVKKEKKPKIKKEKGGDDDVEMDDEEVKAEDEDGEEEVDSDDESSKKRKKKSGSDKPSKRAKTGSSSKSKAKEEDANAGQVVVEMNQHVNLTFSLKYLVNFSKSSSLHSTVQLMMSNDVPLLVAFNFGQGYIRYYLAPKIGDD